MFLEPRKGSVYWLRTDRAEMIHHLWLLRQMEQLAQLQGIRIRPKVDLTESKVYTARANEEGAL